MNLFRQKKIIFGKERMMSGWLLVLLTIIYVSCQENNGHLANRSVYAKPRYSDIKLAVQSDTLHFPLPANAYNKIQTFNYFTKDGTAYMSFYDRRSESVSIYRMDNSQLVKQIFLKKIFAGKRFFKTTVYTKSFDSLLVTNVGDLYLLNSDGVIKKQIPFVQENESMAYFDPSVPVVVKKDGVFMGIRPYVKETSLRAIRNWKIMYDFDLNNKTAALHYQLPALYKESFYGKRFMEYSFCYNTKGRFIFSFPADTNIYETDLLTYNIAHNAKSKFQNGLIEPVSKESLEKDEGSKEYTLRDSYGTIYFDPHTKRYLRVAKQKAEKAALEAGNGKRKYSIIVLSEHFRVIGEYEFNDEFSLNTIFFTDDGRIYARVNAQDETALHFVRLAWENEPNETSQLTKK